MKPPTHPVPSGDRMIARSLIAALRRGGHRVDLASRFRSRDADGNAQRQRRLRTIGVRLAERVVRRYRARDRASRIDCWLTYHLYHKAPDWIGPRVCNALGLPYLVAEASVAHKQAGGPWSLGFEGTLGALRRADSVVALNSTDIDGVRPVIDDAVPLVHLPPFLDLDELEAIPARRAPLRTRLEARHPGRSGEPLLATAAMMRPGNKLESYRVLAAALAQLGASAWRLMVAGDGPARAEVERAFSRFEPGRVVFTGQLSRPALAQMLGGCDLFVWPAVDEPIGMAMLEAQAVGLPVVAGASRGVVDIVRHGVSGYLVEPGDGPGFAAEFAANVSRLLDDPGLRCRLGIAARRLVEQQHSIDIAVARLDRILADALRHRSTRT